MELGQKLKAARLEAGLSQRQLCGDTITRNMLSQIENGTAKPSYATLQILSSRLGKPVSYFMENAPSENLALLYRAAQAEPREALELLKGFLLPDPMLEDWYRLQCATCRMALAKQALSENRTAYARELLEQVEDTKYLPKTQYILLQYQAGMAAASDLQLPDNTEEMLLRAAAALEKGAFRDCLRFLDCADKRTKKWLLLRSRAWIGLERYEDAIRCLLPLEQTGSKEICRLLEQCYRSLNNFEKAYEYACKQR